MKNNFIVVGTCQRLTRQVLLALRSMGNSKCFVIGGANTRNLKWSSLCSANYVVNFERKDARDDDDLFVEIANELGRKHPDIVLIPADCEGTRMINRVGEKLQVRTIPCAELATLNILDNKWSFFEFCQKNELRVPATIFVGEKNRLNFADLSAKLGVPFVIKPVNQAGSTGVHVIRDEGFFNKVIRDNEAYCFDTLIAQQYIDGVDLCFNFFSLGGEITAYDVQRREGKAVHFLRLAELEQMGKRLARLARYSGPMCIDARVDRRTGLVYLIESNPRFWASLGASVWCGLNFVKESLTPAIHSHPPHTITDGVFYERHPILCPAAWKAALLNFGEHGRVVRGQMGDLPVVSSVIGTFAQGVSKRFSRSRMLLKSPDF